MAVEAQLQHPFSSQNQYKIRESLNMNKIGNLGCVYGSQMGSAGISPSADTGGFGVNVNGDLSRKRSRDPLPFLGEDVPSQIYNQMLDVDRLIIQHLTNARMEMVQRWKRFSSQIILAANESVSKRLKSKDDEIEQLTKVNQALEERITSLSAESNAWRYLAQTHEATVVQLRANLEHLLASQEPAVAEDAESCCGDNGSPAEPARDWKRMCRGCGNGEPSVLLLPCRHLCLCSACGPMVDECPVCKCSKVGSVNVNFS